MMKIQENDDDDDVSLGFHEHEDSSILINNCCCNCKCSKTTLSSYCSYCEHSTRPQSFRYYVMAITISCLMTFMLMLFIISFVSFIWLLSTDTNIGFNHQIDDIFTTTTRNNVQNDLLQSSSSSLLLNQKDAFAASMVDDDNQHSRNVGVGHILAINLQGNEARNELSFLKNRRLDNHGHRRGHQLVRNSTKYLSLEGKLGQHLSNVLTINYPLNRLLDLNDFRFIKRNPQRCLNAFVDSAVLNLVIMVHSAVGNFQNRQLIRETWGKMAQNDSYFGSHVRITYVMIVGQTMDPRIQNQIDNEYKTYEDLIQTNTMDTYQNLTYKHFAGLRWTVETCPEADFILKLDDDAYLNLFAVIESLWNYHNLKTIKNSSTRNLLACSLFPEGSQKPRRHGKWSLTIEQYPWEYFPAYCSGVGYLLTPDVAFDLFEAGQNLEENPIIPIDDLFVTGLVADILHPPIKRIALNSLYVYDAKQFRRWLITEDNRNCPLNIWIGDIGTEPDWQWLAKKLWTKTLKSCLNTDDHYSLL